MWKELYMGQYGDDIVMIDYNDTYEKMDDTHCGHLCLYLQKQTGKMICVGKDSRYQRM